MEREKNFSSSQIYKLCSDGKAKGSVGEPFHTYVKEKNREIKSGRAINNFSSSAPTDWGHMLEDFANDYLPLNRRPNKERAKHPSLPWVGIADGFEGKDIVDDIKCPFTLTGYYDLIEMKESVDLIATFKKESKAYYWQLVSNAILNNKSVAKLHVFMPSQSMLTEIRQISEESEKYYFHTKNDDELPFIKDDKNHSVIETIEFVVPQMDVDFLIERVKMASKLLLK